MEKISEPRTKTSEEIVQHWLEVKDELQAYEQESNMNFDFGEDDKLCGEERALRWVLGIEKDTE